MHTALTVESLGLPGAGKTRLCEAAGVALEGAGVRTRLHLRRRRGPGARLRTLAGLVGFVARRPGYRPRSLRRIRAADPADVRWLARTWLKRSAAAFGHRRVPAVHLTDAGVAQALLSLALRARGEGVDRILAELAEEAPLPRLILVLETDDETLARRLARRPGPLAGLPRRLADDAAARARGRRTIQRLAALLGGAGQGAPCEVVVLTSRDESDLAHNVERVLGLVKGLVA